MILLQWSWQILINCDTECEMAHHELQECLVSDTIGTETVHIPAEDNAGVPSDDTMPTAMYGWLDTNVPADLMAFTHTPLPEENSPISVERYGDGNATRPWYTVAQYLLELVEWLQGSISFETTVVSVEKTWSGKWRLTLRRPEAVEGGKRDLWWQEEFDAVIVATGQYSEPFLPKIPGLDRVVNTHPETLEHVNAVRSREQYASKRVVIVGGSFSASDAVGDIYMLVRGPLYVSRSSHSPYITEIWNLSNVEVRPTIGQIEGQDRTKLKLTFSDGSKLDDVDKLIFATGYRFSVPFLSHQPVIKADRVPGTYQHVFRIGDPSLAFSRAC
ncbi:hypothetical protein AN3139.2 [Aspergillus nidulans FGSC A4]|nr:hypothetical protein AN3139.2 [Aspergillus nidulans FGSC A4]|eukprot:XP_660743.1 hypothetical protein AN3139.2 [Aspergillus nidulans FGSC A4]